MKHFLLVAIGILSLNLTACSPPSEDMVLPAAEEAEEPLPELSAVPELPKAEVRENQLAEVPKYEPIAAYKPEWITLDGGNPDLEFNPKMDILFVIDNSSSMKAAQESLSRGINSFASAFQKNQMIDYHLGVISVWDSSSKFVNHPKRRYENGELRKVKIGGREVEQRFLTRKTGTPTALSSTIKIGIAGLADGGSPVPEFEEVFSPISAAIKLTGRGAPNEGFFRPDAHLVVILLSDADDSNSSIRAEQLADELLQFKGSPSKLSVYGVLVKKSDPDVYKDYDLRRHPKYHPECFDMRNPAKPVRDPKKCVEGFGPEEFEKFIVAANPEDGTATDIKNKKIMSLVQKNFGPGLAKIGTDVSMKTLNKEILLDQRAREENGNPMIEVYYGTPEAFAKGKGQKIPYATKGGWRYDPQNNSIRLSGDIEYKYQPGARFMIRMVPVVIGN